MDFVNKYLMPHKGKILVMLAGFSLAFTYWSRYNWLLLLFGLAYIWLGWDSKRRLNWTWKETTWTATLICVITQLPFQIAALGSILYQIVFTLGADCAQCTAVSDSCDSVCIIPYIIAIGMLAIMVAEIAFAVVLANIGHAAAKYLGGKQAVKSVKAKKQTKD